MSYQKQSGKDPVIFIAELTLNEKFSSQYIDEGTKNYEKVKSDFKKEMLSQSFGNWFYNGNSGDHPDLGYFVGYIISKKYYEHSKDKNEAIKNMIDLDFNSEPAVLQFLEKSGYFEDKIEPELIKSAYKQHQPKIVFENGSQDVNPDMKRIQIEFSEPMNDKISINFSKSGKDHFPLKNSVGLDATKTILTLDLTDLTPDTEYDFYITDWGTKSSEGYPFGEQEYKISFKTGKR